MPGGGRSSWPLAGPANGHRLSLRDWGRGLHITAGQEFTHLYLKPGEGIRSPLAALISYQGADPSPRRISGGGAGCSPTTYAQTEPTVEPIRFDYATGRFLPGLKTSEASRTPSSTAVRKKVRLDYWWIDAGWYPCKNDWSDGVGPRHRRDYPQGLKPSATTSTRKSARSSSGSNPSVSPARGSRESFREWIWSAKGSLLNLGNRAAGWLVNHVDKLLTEQGIDLYRQELNMDPFGCAARRGRSPGHLRKPARPGLPGLLG